MKRLLKKIKRLCRAGISICELFCWQYLFRTRRCLKSDNIVIIQNSHIGDFLVSLPFFQRMYAFYGKKLILISDKRIVPLAMSSGCFEYVIGVDIARASSYKHIFYRWKIFLSLRKISAKAVIQKYSAGGSSLEDCFTAIINASEKIGVESEKTYLNGSCQLYGRMLMKNFDRIYKYDTTLNLVKNENAFCNMICNSNEYECVGDLECFEPLPERDEKLGDYALFIVGADDPRRRWEPEKFAWIAEQIVSKYSQVKILFSGSPAEQVVVQEVYESLSDEVKERVVIREPQKDYLYSIKTLMRDVKFSKFILTNDTGPMHIAAKYGCKCYCITGGWHWGLFSPCAEYKNTSFIYHDMSCYNCGGVCRYGTVPFRCLQEVSAETVLECIMSESF